MIKTTIPIKAKLIWSLDNANYIYLHCSQHTELYTLEKNGYLIGNITFKINTLIRVFNIYVDSKPDIYTSDGENLISADILEKYLTENREGELHFETSSYIKIVEKESPLTFHGIYTCIEEAENYVYKVRECNITNYFEFIDYEQGEISSGI